MTILEFQKEIAAALNGVESLVQGGCKAFAEDTATVLNDINTQLASAGGVAIAVTTPALRKGGSEISPGLAIEGSLVLRISEKPELNRKKPGHITALDAALIAAQNLDGTRLGLETIEQAFYPQSGNLTVSVTFAFTGVISVRAKVSAIPES